MFTMSSLNGKMTFHLSVGLKENRRLAGRLNGLQRHRIIIYLLVYFALMSRSHIHAVFGIMLWTRARDSVRGISVNRKCVHPMSWKLGYRKIYSFSPDVRR